jgi:hypothetical protein
MADDDLELKLGRIGDAGKGRLQKHGAKALRIAGRTGARAIRRYGHLKPAPHAAEPALACAPLPG